MRQKSLGLGQRVADYLKGARAELKKVIWPNRQATIRLTLIVIGVSLAVAVFLGGLDFLFATLLRIFVF